MSINYRHVLAVGTCLIASGIHSQPAQAGKVRPLKGWIVADIYRGRDHSPALIAISPDGKHRRLLKRELSIQWWDVDQSGAKLCFADFPVDREFFNARAGRCYLFQYKHDQPQPQFLIGAYEPGAKDDRDFSNASWSWDGQRIVLCAGYLDNQLDDYGAVFFNCNTLTLEEGWLKKWSTHPQLRRRQVSGPRLSPDGKSVLLIALSPARGTDAFYAETDWSQHLVKVDLKTGQLKVLQSTSDAQGFHSVRWHPNGRDYAYSVYSRDGGTSPRYDVFIGNLHSGKTRKFPYLATNGFIEWSPDGKQVVFGSNRPIWRADVQLPKMNRLFVANSDGRRLRCLASDLNLYTRVRWTRTLADWSKYSDVPLRATVGPKATPTPIPTPK